MLKKQTVWLLTMLSLMIVLSVYYIMSEKDGQSAFINNEEADLATSDETTDRSDDNEDATEVNDISNIGQDQLFTTFRMELQNERSMKKSNLKEIVASSTATTEEKNEAFNDINTIDATSTKESILQSSILDAVEEYQDVLVRHDHGKDVVHVHVKAGEQLSNKEVVDIMQMVRDEFGELTVNVNRQPTES